MKLAVCIGCACRDDRACVNQATGEACSWIEVDYEARRGVCTDCAAHLPRWTMGDRIVGASAQLGISPELRRQAVDTMLSKWKASGYVPDATYLARLERYVDGEIHLRHVEVLARLEGGKA